MSNDKPAVIGVGYAKRALTPGTREHERLRANAIMFKEHHLVVFTRAREGFLAEQHFGNFHLYATNARTGVGMIVRAGAIVRDILRRAPAEHFVLSAQDPLYTSAALLPLVGEPNTRFHVQLHGDYFSPYNLGHGFMGFVKRHFALHVLRLALGIRVVSERIKHSLMEKGIPAEHITVLPIQADLAQFLAVGAARSYEVTSAPVSLYVGRFSEEKNVSLLLRAFAAGKRRGLKGTLQLLGEGALRPRLEREAAALGLTADVAFLPWTNDVPAVMATADVLCLSSDHEGYAMVLKEAMAAGLPIVTTDVGCAGEVVVSGIHGLVVPVRNEALFTAALMTVAEYAPLREEFGRAGYEKAKASLVTDEEYLLAIQNSYVL